MYIFAVVQLERDGSSCKIIQQICKDNLIESRAAQIECILRVQKKQETFACFEESRDMVRTKAERLQNEHPRCLVDGNELLRFHGTTIACSLGLNGSSTLCTLEQCGVCQILRHGFSANKEFHGARGVYTPLLLVEKPLIPFVHHPINLCLSIECMLCGAE